jgi:hypothetical protein
MLDARLVTPRPRDVDGWNLPTRTEGRGKEAARGLLKVHALAREQVSSLGVHISRRGSHLHGRIPDHRLTLLAPQGRRARAHLTFVFRPRDAPGGGRSHTHRAWRFAHMSAVRAYMLCRAGRIWLGSGVGLRVGAPRRRQRREGGVETRARFPDFPPLFPCGAALGVPHLSRYFRIVKCFRAQRGRYGASSHDHDRIDGRDDAGFPDDDLNRVVSVLLASIIDILPHDTSVFYRPPRRSDASQANNGIG